MGVDSLPEWLGHQPLIETVHLRLTPPHLGDNTADLDRLLRVLRQHGYSAIQVHPLRVGTFAELIRQRHYEVTAVLGYTSCHWELLDIKAADVPVTLLAFAIDLGSSRLAFYLLDVGQGRILAQDAVANPQIPHGEDILTRIQYARDEKGRRHLQRLLIECFNDTMGRMLAESGFSTADVYAVATAGNTTMSHLLLGLDPSSICREPYIPVVNQFPWLHSQDLGLAVHAHALVYVFPNVGSYFGGDLIAGILASGMHRSSDVNILVDVGTNAEVVVGNRDWLIACAGAAGPALEGGVV
ncbi:MAG TPA: hypothetical protein DEO88_04655, partial [Syntrophobacteraceae bacterium]|nr:hypothetical protein [Syntrophobacteraceae bacterium]